jgi:hypothetical protein
MMIDIKASRIMHFSVKMKGSDIKGITGILSYTTHLSYPSLGMPVLFIL